MTAFSLLDEQLTEAESWEVYAAIDVEQYEVALVQMRDLVGGRDAADAIAALEVIEQRGRWRP